VRPLAISMQAFGPFPDKQELDLRQLTFFLIHGPTGAGKTTILDAMCFALYGVTSGAERDGRQMRSHLAQPNTLTEVDLDFSLGGRIYRLFRRPEQERPKLRGEGMTKEKAEATLWDRTEAGDDDEGRVIETGWSKVTEKVIDLLGCDSDQFRQVIVLPQGQFRKLLLADSKDRQVILETLFEAEKYRRIQRLLKDAAGKVRDDVRTWQERLDGILRQASVEDIPPLEVTIREMKSESERMDARIAELRAVETKAQADLEKGRKDAEQLKALATVEKALAELLDRKGEMEAKADILARAKRAVLVKAAETGFLKRLDENASAKQRLAESEKALQEAETKLSLAEKNFSAETARDKEREAARKQINDLESLVPRVKGLRDLERQASEARQAAEKAINKEAAARQASETAEKEILETEKLLTEYRPLANELASIKLKSQSLTKSLENVGRLVELKADIEKQQKVLETKADELSIAGEALSKARADYDTCDQQWRAGRAAALASDLSPGQPCPVCGSTNHPSPAHAEHTIPSDLDLESTREAVKSAENFLNKTHKDYNSADRAVTDLQARLKTLTESLEDGASADPAALESQAKEANLELARAETAVETVKQLEANLADVKARSTELKKELERTQAIKHQAEKNQAECAASLKQASSDIPEDMRDESGVEKALADFKAALARMEKALADARDNESRARNGVSAHKASAAEITSQVRDSAKHLNEAEQALAESLGKSGFNNMDDFRAACLPDDVMEEMEISARKYETDCASAQSRLNELRESTRGISPPDIDSLEASAKTSRSDLEAAVSAKAALKARQEQHETWLRDARAAGDKLDALESEYGVMGHLADVAAGTAHDNQYNLAFQNFVLAALLDDVLAAATMRFRIMSRGRYQLIRSVRGRDGRKTWGLDLAVVDEYTGQERAVATLSGGESFLAALALALGLADVVQAYAGGIHLEAVFVDEGFGSLDPEALDLAIRALTDLHQSGRMVGIISHVPELRECIDSRLEVTGGRSGSTARVIHP
jgi:exonuclease SbcC